MSEKLVLASGSPFRKAMLENAGVPVETVPAGLDERALEAPLKDSGTSPEDVALVLAEAKAVEVSERKPGRLVLGCDQTLTCDGELMHKPADMAEARRQLVQLRGRTHRLHSALALCRDGATLWTGLAEASMAMRRFSDAFLDAYLHAAGPDVLGSVGVYRYESLGAHLFDSVSGDDATILGLPVLPLLAGLRQHGYLAG